MKNFAQYDFPELRVKDPPFNPEDIDKHRSKHYHDQLLPEITSIRSLSFEEPEYDDPSYGNIYIFKKNDWNEIRSKIKLKKAYAINNGSVIKADGLDGKSSTTMDHNIFGMQYDQSKIIEDEIKQKTGIAMGNYLKFTKTGENHFINISSKLPTIAPKVVAIAIKVGKNSTTQTGGDSDKKVRFSDTISYSDDENAVLVSLKEDEENAVLVSPKEDEENALMASPKEDDKEDAKEDDKENASKKTVTDFVYDLLEYINHDANKSKNVLYIFSDDDSDKELEEARKYIKDKTDFLKGHIQSQVFGTGIKSKIDNIIIPVYDANKDKTSAYELFIITYEHKDEDIYANHSVDIVVFEQECNKIIRVLRKHNFKQNMEEKSNMGITQWFRDKVLTKKNANFSTDNSKCKQDHVDDDNVPNNSANITGNDPLIGGKSSSQEPMIFLVEREKQSGGNSVKNKVNDNKLGDFIDFTESLSGELREEIEEKWLDVENKTIDKDRTYFNKLNDKKKQIVSDIIQKYIHSKQANVIEIKKGGVEPKEFDTNNKTFANQLWKILKEYLDKHKESGNNDRYPFMKPYIDRSNIIKRLIKTITDNDFQKNLSENTIDTKTKNIADEMISKNKSFIDHCINVVCANKFSQEYVINKLGVYEPGTETCSIIDSEEQRPEYNVSCKPSSLSEENIKESVPSPYLIMIEEQIKNQNEVDILNQENIDLEHEIIEKANQKDKTGGSFKKGKQDILLNMIKNFLTKFLDSNQISLLDMVEVATILTQKIENEDRIQGLNINDILTGGKRN
jgi:hypothetical protein